MTHTKSRPRRLVHLTEHHNRVFQYIGSRHLTIEFFRLTAPFTNAAKETDSLVHTDHVVNHLRDHHCLAHTGSTEEAGLAAFFKRDKGINRLDACKEYVGKSRTLAKGHRIAVDGSHFSIGERFVPVYGFPEYVEHTSKQFFPDRRTERTSRIKYRRSPVQPPRGIQRNSPYCLVIQMSHHLDYNIFSTTSTQFAVYSRQLHGEKHIYHASPD